MEEVAISIIKKLQAAGHITYFAGGSVRDYLLGISSSDIDLSTSATPDEVIALFPKTVEVGKAFGVVIVIEEGHLFEIASFRKDGLYIDGRRPLNIEKASAREDALRRDFTINGLFYNPLTDEIIDFVEGQEDIKKGIVRAIGIPEDRFTEDRLRMIRAVRFAARFNFVIDQATEEAIKSLSYSLFPAVAKERVWQEWGKMGEREGLGRALLILQKLHLLKELLPEIAERDLTLAAEKLDLLPSSIPLSMRWALAFEEPSLLERLKWMNISFDEFEAFNYGLKGLMLIHGEDGDPVHFVELFAHPMSEHFLNAITLLNPKVRGALEDQKEKLKIPIERRKAKKKLITSAKLVQEGISPGKKMGKLLHLGEHEAIRRNFKTEEEVLNYLKTLSDWTAP